MSSRLWLCCLVLSCCLVMSCVSCGLGCRPFCRVPVCRCPLPCFFPFVPSGCCFFFCLFSSCLVFAGLVFCLGLSSAWCWVVFARLWLVCLGGSLLSSCVASWFCCFRVSCSPLPGAYFQVELFTARLLGLVWWGVGLVRLGAPCVLSCLVLSFGWALLCLVVGCFLFCPGSAVLCLVWPSPPLFLVPGRWPLLRCCCICVAAGLLAGAALLAFDFFAGGGKI